MVAGPIVTFGFLVVPPLAARLVTSHMVTFSLVAAAIGGVAAFVGFYCAYRFDLPLGPAQVAVATSCCSSSPAQSGAPALGFQRREDASLALLGALRRCRARAGAAIGTFGRHWSVRLRRPRPRSSRATSRASRRVRRSPRDGRRVPVRRYGVLEHKRRRRVALVACGVLRRRPPTCTAVIDSADCGARVVGRVASATLPATFVLGATLPTLGPGAGAPSTSGPAHPSYTRSTRSVASPVSRRSASACRRDRCRGELLGRRAAISAGGRATGPVGRRRRIAVCAGSDDGACVPALGLRAVCSRPPGLPGVGLEVLWSALRAGPAQFGVFVRRGRPRYVLAMASARRSAGLRCGGRRGARSSPERSWSGRAGHGRRPLEFVDWTGGLGLFRNAERAGRVPVADRRARRGERRDLSRWLRERCCRRFGRRGGRRRASRGRSVRSPGPTSSAARSVRSSLLFIAIPSSGVRALFLLAALAYVSSPTPSALRDCCRPLDSGALPIAAGRPAACAAGELASGETLRAALERGSRDRLGRRHPRRPPAPPRQLLRPRWQRRGTNEPRPGLFPLLLHPRRAASRSSAWRRGSAPAPARRSACRRRPWSRWYRRSRRWPRRLLRCLERALLAYRGVRLVSATDGVIWPRRR